MTNWRHGISRQWQRRQSLMFCAAVALAAVGAGAVATSSTRLLAQAAPLQAPSFDAASIKQNKSGSPFTQLGGPPGRFVATNLPLRVLITFAYQLQDFQLEGGPNWLNTDRFDIVANTNAGAVSVLEANRTASPVQLMLRNLLAERFSLRLHHETRELPIYELVLARADGKLGPALQKSTADCSEMLNAMKNGGQVGVPKMGGPNGRPVCGLRGGPASLQAGGFPIGPVARFFSDVLQRVVLDRTGLTDNYDFELRWMPDQMPRGGGANPQGPSPFLPADPNAPALPVALQEQLGLKLQSAKGPVDVWVIERAERPTEN